MAGNPAAQIVVGGLVLMLAFPATPMGSLGRLITFGALGVGLLWSWETVPAAVRAPSPRAATWYALLIVGLAGFLVFWPVISTSPSPEWQTGDWGPQHAVLAKLMP